MFEIRRAAFTEEAEYYYQILYVFRGKNIFRNCFFRGLDFRIFLLLCGFWNSVFCYIAGKAGMWGCIPYAEGDHFFEKVFL